MSSVPGKAPAVKRPPSVETRRELLLEQLERLLTIEETLAKLVLPELLLELQDDGLTKIVQHHLSETQGHAGHVKEAFLALGEAPAGKPAYGLDGLRTEQVARLLRANLEQEIAALQNLGEQADRLAKQDVAN